MELLESFLVNYSFLDSFLGAGLAYYSSEVLGSGFFL